MKRRYYIMNQEVIKNTQICPMCGSEMKRDKSDSPHDLYTENYTCQKRECENTMTVYK